MELSSFLDCLLLEYRLTANSPVLILNSFFFFFLALIHFFSGFLGLLIARLHTSSWLPIFLVHRPCCCFTGDQHPLKSSTWWKQPSFLSSLTCPLHTWSWSGPPRPCVMENRLWSLTGRMPRPSSGADRCVGGQGLGNECPRKGSGDVQLGP